MLLNNFRKSTAELNPFLILKGEQDNLLYVSELVFEQDQKIIYLYLSKQPANVILQDLQIQTQKISSEYQIFLFNPQTNTKTYTFGYYIRDQILVIK